MKLKLKKDIVIKKGTVFNDIVGSVSHYYHDMYDTIIALDKDTSAKLVVSSENKQYFEVVE